MFYEHKVLTKPVEFQIHWYSIKLFTIQWFMEYEFTTGTSFHDHNFCNSDVTKDGFNE